MSTINSPQSLTLTDFSTFNREVNGQREINGKPSYTVKEAADVLTRTGQRWLDNNGDGWTDVSYRMRDKPGELFPAYGLGGFSALDTAAQEAAKAAMNKWSDVAKVRFTDATSGGTSEGNIAFSQFATTNGPFDTSLASSVPTADTQRFAAKYPELSRVGVTSEIFLDANDQAVTAPSPNNQGLALYLHEVGHALGLSHPHEVRLGGPRYAQDTIGYSVMSYWEEHRSGQNFTKNGMHYTPVGPMVDDIAAIQKLYGANRNVRTGNTTYGFNSNADCDYFRLKRSTDVALFTIWDPKGESDAMDFSGYSDDQLINLNPGQRSNIGGMVGNVFIALGVTIENAIGGTGNDVFIPNRAQNTLTGNGGNNTYKYLSVKQSTPDKPDRITDFVSGKDKVDVSEMHRKGARKGAKDTESNGQRPPALVGPVKLVEQFSGRRSEAVLSYDPAAKQARLEIDVKGNGTADFLLLIDSQTPLKPTDIVVAKSSMH